MTRPNLYYEVVIAPNRTNALPTPEELGRRMQQTTTKNLLKKILPAFDNTTDVITRSLLIGTPDISIEPTVTQVTYYNATISLRLWDIGRVFGVVLENPELAVDGEEEIISPSSDQI